MVSDLPLNLYSTQFEDVEWSMSEYAREHVIRLALGILGHCLNLWMEVKSLTVTLFSRSTQELWGKYSVKSAIIRSQLDTLDRMPGGEVS